MDSFVLETPNRVAHSDQGLPQKLIEVENFSLSMATLEMIPSLLKTTVDPDKLMWNPQRFVQW